MAAAAAKTDKHRPSIPRAPSLCVIFGDHYTKQFLILPRDPGYQKTKMADENDTVDTENKPSEKPTVPRTATELQKLKLDKLMKDPVSRNSVIIRD